MKYIQLIKNIFYYGSEDNFAQNKWFSNGFLTIQSNIIERIPIACWVDCKLELEFSDISQYHAKFANDPAIPFTKEPILNRVKFSVQKPIYVKWPMVDEFLPEPEADIIIEDFVFEYPNGLVKSNALYGIAIGGAEINNDIVQKFAVLKPGSKLKIFTATELLAAGIYPQGRVDIAGDIVEFEKVKALNLKTGIKNGLVNAKFIFCDKEYIAQSQQIFDTWRIYFKIK